MIEDNKDTIGILSQEVTNNEAHISENYLRIRENSANIGSNSEDILALLPVGTVIAWLGADSESSLLRAGWFNPWRPDESSQSLSQRARLRPRALTPGHG